MDSKGVGGMAGLDSSRERTFAVVNVIMNFQVANSTRNP